MTVDHVATSAADGENTAPVGPASAAVFVPFAGYDRDTIKVIPGKLGGPGWAAQGAEQGADHGGGRIASTASLNDVRFLHPDDKLRAGQVAQVVYDALDGASSMKVADVSGLKQWARDQPGHIDIRISA